MASQTSTGHEITPLTLWVAGIACSLIAFIGITGLAMLNAVRNDVTTLVTSQRYDRKELDDLKGDVQKVEVEVRSLSERVGRVEARK